MIPFVATIIIWQLTNAGIATSVNNKFQQQAERQNEAITSRLDTYRNTLRGGVGLFEASDFVSRDEWETYVAALELNVNYPGIQGVGYGKAVSDDELQEYTEAVRAEGFPNFTVHPSGTRAEYAPVTYLEPFNERNQQAFGYDMLSEATRNEAIMKARSTAKASNSGRIILQQETDQDIQAGFLMILPQYSTDTTNKSQEQRETNVEGYVYAAFRADDFIKGIFETDDRQVLLEIYDDDVSLTEDTLLHRDSLLSDELKANARVSKRFTLINQGRPWTVVQYASEDFSLTGTEESLPNLVLIIAAVIAALTTLIVASQIGSKNRAEHYADQVTKDLRKFQQAVQSSTDAIMFTTPDSKVVFVNPAWEELTGYNLTEIQELGTDVLKSSTTPESVYEEMAKAKKKGEPFFTEDIINKHKEGGEYNIQLSVYPIKSDDRTIFYVGIEQDISKRMEINKAKTEFVSLASHQLRTPLSAINWYTEMLLAGDAGKLNDEQKKYAEEIFIGNSRMVELVNSLLNVSRIETNSFTIEPEKINIIDISKEVVKEIEPDIFKQKQELIEEYDEYLPDTYLDKKLTKIIIQNLLTNASKYTPENGEIRIKIYNTSGDIRIEVSDNGLGIPGEEQRNIFNKLFRASNVTPLDTDGTGLGLYIVKSVIERSGGKIWFKSIKDKGTTFFVELPESGMRTKKGDKGTKH